jgi:hypothetical protein
MNLYIEWNRLIGFIKTLFLLLILCWVLSGDVDVIPPSTLGVWMSEDDGDNICVLDSWGVIKRGLSSVNNDETDDDS